MGEVFCTRVPHTPRPSLKDEGMRKCIFSRKKEILGGEKDMQSGGKEMWEHVWEECRRWKEGEGERWTRELEQEREERR